MPLKAAMESCNDTDTARQRQGKVERRGLCGDVWLISDREKRNLRWEAQQFRKGQAWKRWDYPYPVGDGRLDEMQPVQAAYTTDNWRTFRTWGLSGNSPWEHDRF
jgi:hypothetical protein